MHEISIPSKKIAIFSDIHWGKSRDSDAKLNATVEFMDWFLEFLQKRNITQALFLGDWFNNRNMISVKTENLAYDSLRKLSDSGITVYMVIGNHDAYYKETISVNSVRPYESLKGVVPIQDLTKVRFIETSREGLLCPWGKFNTEELPSPCDAVFGHLEFCGAQYVGAVNTTGAPIAKLLEVAPLVFSGHFHLRKDYPHKHGKLITVGCPLELDWGDVDNVKGVYVLDVEDMSYEFVENDFSPRHIKVYWSRLKNRTEDLNQIRGNYVKFVIDTEYKFEQVLRIVNALNSKSPIKPCETDFVYNENLSNMLEGMTFDIDESDLTTSKLDHITRFVNEADDLVDGLDKGHLVEVAENYYERALKELKQ